MSLLGKVKNMLGIGQPKVKKADYIAPDLSQALQRNEMASERARQALHDFRMSGTVADIARKM